MKSTIYPPPVMWQTVLDSSSYIGSEAWFSVSKLEVSVEAVDWDTSQLQSRPSRC
jgi:hypothetical protein